MPDDNPLNEAHLQRIQDALAGLDKADRHIQLAKMAGLDVTAMEQQTRDSRAKLLQLKQVYFPGR